MRLLLVQLPLMAGLVAAATSYTCSTQNTGVAFSPIYDMYQSAGLCSGTCSGYSFAILQGFNCYCGNYAPGSTVQSKNCNTACPGFPSDICGGTNNGVYAYYQLAQAAGTSVLTTSQPASSTTSSSSGNVVTTSLTNDNESGQTTSTTQPSTVAPVTQTVTQSAQTPTGVTSNTRQSSTTSTTTRSTTANSSGTSTSSAQQQSSNRGNGFFDSPGKVAGTFVAVAIIAIALIGGIIFACCLRRRNQDRSNSSAALFRKSPDSGTEYKSDDIERSRSGSASRLMGYGAFAGAGAAAGNGIREKPLDNSRPIEWPQPHDRAELVRVDQRLNPRPMLMRFDSNYSRHSLRDEEDYSRRVLTVANPDD